MAGGEGIEMGGPIKKHQITKVALALLGCACGGALAFGLGHFIVGSPNWKTHILAAVFTVPFAFFAISAKYDGVLNWPLYVGKSILYAFLFTVLFEYAAG